MFNRWRAPATGAVASFIALTVIVGRSPAVAQDTPSAVPQTQPAHAAVVSAGFIYDQAPYPQCHASTLVEIEPGTLGAAWFGGTRERHPDVCIWFARHEKGRWGEPANVADGVQPDGTRLPTWNPVLFRAPNGPLLLFYKVGPSPSTWWGMVKTSGDGGQTWGEARRLPDGVLGPVKNKPIVLADGTWLSGSSTEGNGWRLQFERSTDGGATWTVVRTAAPAEGRPMDAIQPSVLVHRDGRLQVLCRTRSGVVGQTWSSDGGRTWGPVTATTLPNPNSGTDALTLQDGRHLIVYNHSAPPPERPTKGPRYPIDVAVSDDGVKWTRVLTLDDKPVGNGYAYPAVIQTSDGLVHVSYTFDRKKIKHVVLDPKQLSTADAR